MSDQIKKTRMCIFLQSAFGFQSFFGTIMVVFYTTYMGLSFSQYLFLDGLLFALIAFFEIPSGYLSDKVGRKKMILLSRLFEILAMIVLVVMRSYTGALIAAILNGIFGAMESGNADALYFELFQKENAMDMFKKTMGKASTISMICATVCSVASGYLAEYSLALPVIADIVLLSLSTCALAVLLEDNEKYRADAKFSLIQDYEDNKHEIADVIPYFAFFAIMFALFRVSYSVYQPLLQETGIPVKYFGYIFAAANFVSAFSSNLIAEGKVKHEAVPFIVMTVFGVSVLGIYAVHSALVVAFLFVQQFIRGLALPYLRVESQQVIPADSKLRVTYGSVSSLMNKLTISLITWIYSLMTFDSIHPSYAVIGTAMLVLYIVLYKCTAGRHQQS